MKQNTFLRHCKTALPFLAGWFGSQIFGPVVWHFVAANVERWWSHGAIGDIIAGLVGTAVFVAVKEANRAKNAAVAEDRKRQLAQFMERASQREQVGREAK